MKRSRSRLTNIHQSLNDLLGGDRLEILLAITRLRRSWHNIVGPMMAVRTEPVQIEALDEGNCLWIAVDHPVMAQQIRFLRDDIRKACFRESHLASLIKIRTRVRDGAGIKPELKKVKRPLSLTEKKAAAHELRAVTDKTLRRAMYEARVAQIAFGET